MNYANLIYSDFCKKVGDKLHQKPIDMGYGDPSLNQFIPKDFLSLLQQELTQKNAGAYSNVQGDPTLINAIKQYIKQDEEVVYDYNVATVTAGGRSALTNLLAAITNPNDIILIPYPAWSGYKSLAKFLRITIYPITTSIKNNFVPTSTEIENAIREVREKYPHQNIKAIILNSPHSPTSTVYSKKVIREILSILHVHQIICIADYTYRAIRDNTYLIPSFNRIAEDLEQEANLKKYTFTDRVISMQTFGKVTLTPGLRIGYVSSTNKEIIEKFCEKKQATDFGGHVFIQKAMARYLGTNQQKRQFQEINTIFKARRTILIDNLQRYGYDSKNNNIIISDVGFYVSFKVPRKYQSITLKEASGFLQKFSFIRDTIDINDYINLFQERGYLPASEVFVLHLIEKTGINVLPGHLFCPFYKDEYENWVRVALIQDEETIQEAFTRVNKELLQY